MMPNMPRWLIITIIALVVAAIATGLFFLIRWNPTVGWITTGLLIALIAVLAAINIPPLLKLYKFQKYFKEHENAMLGLAGLMQSGRIAEATQRFESVMKEAPDNPYVHYMRAFFLYQVQKFPDAYTAAGRALKLADSDPYLPMLLQQAAGQYDQPTTVRDFKLRLTELRDNLEPRLSQARERREKAVERRKKKSR